MVQHAAQTCSPQQQLLCGCLAVLPGTAEATPVRKQAKPGAPNPKPGTTPGPSVVKRSAVGQPALEQNEFPSSWSVGGMHVSQRQHA